MPYSCFLFSPAHAANKPNTRPPTRYCCADAFTNKDFILCATCPHQPQKRMPDDDYDDNLPSPDWTQPEISHGMSPDFEGPLWE